MFNAADLPANLAIFPLPGVLMLPRTRLPLHIFEPRYLAMVDDVLKTGHRLIGMIQPVPGSEGEENLHEIGCAGRITAFSEAPDGRYMITLSGISRFRINAREPGFSPYIRADVEWAEFHRDLAGAEHDTGFERTAFLKLLERYFTVQELDTDWENLREAEDENLINSLSILCPFSPEDRQALLEAPALHERRSILTTLLEYGACGGENEETMQ